MSAVKEINLANCTPTQRAFVRARYVSTPLILIRTAEPASTVASLAAVAQTSNEKEAPVIQWDAMNGYQAVNTPGKAVVQATKESKNLITALEAALTKTPDDTTVVMLWPLPDTIWRDMLYVQAVWNLRDPYKVNFRTLVIVVPTGTVPPALEHDFYIIDDPLPGPAELERIVLNTVAAGKIAKPTDAELKRATDATAGLSQFAAESAVAMSLNRKGIDHDQLRERHRQIISNAKGLSVWRGGETFDDMGGLANWKKFANSFIKGSYRFASVFWIDEIEKAFGGLRGDLTGISQDYLGVLLGYMADNKVPGILLMGHPGTAKSLSAKAMGNTAKVPTVRADLQAMHGSLVGESQHALRSALKVVSAVSQGRPLFVATCNSVAILPPEFINRFKYRFFFDLPTAEEKAAIWPIHLKAYGLDPKQERPADTDWNGREIEQACATAHELQIPLVEASNYIVPIAQSSAEDIERRRQEANGRYLSASRPGPFLHDAKDVIVGGVQRQIRMRDEDPKWVAPGGSGKPN